MTIKKAIYKYDNGTTYDDIYFKTSSDQVVNVDGTTVQAHINSINALIESGSLKGDTWKPSVDGSGNLTWTINNGTTPPTTVNIKGAKGDSGGTGATGNTWKPSVDSSGNLTWVINSGTTPPTTVNIKGAKGDNGANGKDGTQIIVSATQPPTHTLGGMWIQLV